MFQKKTLDYKQDVFHEVQEHFSVGQSTHFVVDFGLCNCTDLLHAQKLHNTLNEREKPKKHNRTHLNLINKMVTHMGETLGETIQRETP